MQYRKKYNPTVFFSRQDNALYEASRVRTQPAHEVASHDTHAHGADHTPSPHPETPRKLSQKQIDEEWANRFETAQVKPVAPTVTTDQTKHADIGSSGSPWSSPSSFTDPWGSDWSSEPKSNAHTGTLKTAQPEPVPAAVAAPSWLSSTSAAEPLDSWNGDWGSPESSPATPVATAPAKTVPATPQPISKGRS